MNARKWAWSPQLGPQTDAISATWCPELFYGGAAGGGKSDFLLGDFLQDVDRYAASWRGVIFRRTYPELEELLARSFELYPATGAKWMAQSRVWQWPNGALLRMRYLESDVDALRYQGHQYTWIGWDEMTQWATSYAYKYLRGRLRSASPVPTKRIRAAGNPGGPGHQWVKQYFVDPAPAGYSPLLDAQTQQERMFIPSKLRDNQILVHNDPTYVNRLQGVGSAELVRALLDGDWNVVQGAFFDFTSARHVVLPCALPDSWHRFRAMDWGYAKPFSVGWYAISDGELPQFPKGALVKYREWYGCAGEPNVGIRLDAEALAAGVLEREIDDPRRDKERPRMGFADPSIFAQDGGPSIAERMIRAGCHWVPADNKRIPGWDQMRSRLGGENDMGTGDRPMLYFFSTCVDSIRTIPALQHDKTKAEDVDTDGEDHAGDETRYACMSRPYVRPKPAVAVPNPAIQIGGQSTVTMDQLWAHHDRQRRAGRGRI